MSKRPILNALAAVALAALTLNACASGPVEAPGAETVASDRPTVILISVDGLHPDYLERGVSPTLARLKAEGASGPMRPSFPSVTFPNHYTLVTGKHPDNHGIVGNTMVDDELGRFSLGNAAAVTDRRWWDQAEPIWVTAEKAGLTTGTMFWPGSEAAIQGVRPTYWTKFDQAMPGDARVDQVLAWLDRPEGERPDFATLYFDIVDTAGHNHGPDADETTAALASVDGSIARLIAGLEARGLADDTVLIVVSDHGMAATSPERVMVLDDIVDPTAVDIVYGGSVVFLNAAPGREADASIAAALVKRHAHGECWTRQTIPARFVLGRNPRVTDFVCAADPGWLFATRARPVTREGGAHGYDNQAPEMAAVFIAHGLGIARGVSVSDLDSVDVQPLLGRLLGLSVPPGDGRAEDTAAVIAP